MIKFLAFEIYIKARETHRLEQETVRQFFLLGAL
jgi:hypothetical protein